MWGVLRRPWKTSVRIELRAAQLATADFLRSTSCANFALGQRRKFSRVLFIALISPPVAAVVFLHFVRHREQAPERLERLTQNLDLLAYPLAASWLIERPIALGWAVSLALANRLTKCSRAIEHGTGNACEHDNSLRPPQCERAQKCCLFSL